MPTLVEINGLDEAGQVGDSIFFVRVAVGLPNEPHIILRNIEYFDSIIATKDHLRGYEPSTLFKYFLNFQNDPTVDVTIFKMFPDVQLKLIKELSMLTAQDMYECRKTLTNLFGSDGQLTDIDPQLTSALSQSVDKLTRFRRPKIWLESFVKSYGMMEITKQIPSFSKIMKDTGSIEKFLVIQIDGGFPFACWWKSLITKKGSFKKGKFTVNGVAHGDNNYPVMSAAGTIASALTKNPEKLHFFPIHPIKYNEEFDLRGFCSDHARAIESPIFQARMLFIGKLSGHVRNTLPYLMHLRDRKKTYEAYGLTGSVKWFWKVFGIGYPENTMIIQGENLSIKDKDNLDACEEKAYQIVHISEFEDDFQNLFNKLQSEIKYAPPQKRKILSSKLKKIEEECLSEKE